MSDLIEDVTEAPMFEGGLFPDDSTPALQARIRELENDLHEARKTASDFVKSHEDLGRMAEAMGLDKNEFAMAELLLGAIDYRHCREFLNVAHGELELELNACAECGSGLDEERKALVDLLGKEDILGEVTRLKESLLKFLQWDMVELVRELIDTLPKCDRHPDRPATRAWKRGSSRYCDECGTKDVPLNSEPPEYPRAEALRKLTKILNTPK